MPTDPPGKKLWLFNIAEDPNEYHDLSESQPDIVELLLDRLQAYYSTAIPVKYPPGDPDADPALHNGTWTNWGDEECAVYTLWDLIRYLFPENLEENYASNTLY